MTELEKDFVGRGTVRGFKYHQLFKDEVGFIYEVTSEEGEKWYEVFKREITKENDTLINGVVVHFEERERFPSDNWFGLTAWCCNSYDKALCKLKILKERTKNDGNK